MMQKEPKLSEMISPFGESTLHCPACDGVYLHHGRVEVFNRAEDATDGTHVTVDGNDVKSDRNLVGNPSGRRHGLTIHFACENCAADVKMHVYQQKGNTFVRMQYQTNE